jgi:hypothetical protein
MNVMTPRSLPCALSLRGRTASQAWMELDMMSSEEVDGAIIELEIDENLPG